MGMVTLEKKNLAFRVPGTVPGAGLPFLDAEMGAFVKILQFFIFQFGLFKTNATSLRCPQSNARVE